MAEETREEKDEILEDIESSPQMKVEQPGYVMTIYPDGVVQIATGGMQTRIPVRVGNPHYSCCCSHG